MNHDDSEKILSHKDLLRTFGAGEELADEMLNDQGNFFPTTPQMHLKTSMKTCYMSFILHMYGFGLFFLTQNFELF